MLVKTGGYRHCPLVKGIKVEFSRGVSMFIYRAGKRRRRGSTGAFTRCSTSVDTSLQNSANLSSAFLFFNVLMVMADSDRHSAAENDCISRNTHTHTQVVSIGLFWSRSRPNTKSKKNSNCCMCRPYLFSTKSSVHFGDCAITL